MDTEDEGVQESCHDARMEKSFDMTGEEIGAVLRRWRDYGGLPVTMGPAEDAGAFLDTLAEIRAERVGL